MLAVTASLLLAPLIPAVGGTLDASFHYLSLGAELDTACTGSSAVHYRSEVGTLTFLANGTFSVSATRTTVCPDGTQSSAAIAPTGTYVLAGDGTLTLDYASPSDPDDVLQVDPERNFAMRKAVRGEQAGVLYATRTLVGADPCLLDGEYALVELALKRSTFGFPEFESAFGEIEFVCAGATTDFTTSVTEHIAGICVNSPPSPDSGSLAVQPDGSVPLGPQTFGAVMAGGELAWVLDWSGAPPDGELFLSLLVRKGTSYSAQAMEGHWHWSQLDCEAGVNSVTVAFGDIGIDSLGGRLGIDGEEFGVDEAPSSGGGALSGTEDLSLAASGFFRIGTPPEDVTLGWVGSTENVALVAVIDECLDAIVGVAVRQRDGGPGLTACIGLGCPCANDDLTAGCATSTGSGGLLSGTGSASVTADDLVLTATGLPPMNQGLFYMGDTFVRNPLFDGYQCALGSTFRFLGAIQNSGAGGTMVLGAGIVAASGSLIDPGETWWFHCWHRDDPGSPCGTGANLTSLYGVPFTP